MNAARQTAGGWEIVRHGNLVQSDALSSLDTHILVVCRTAWKKGEARH